MGRFAIECPVCGKYAEAKTGFFTRKKIECACGNVIDVRTDKLASRICGHCGNQVVFDQSKGESAKCPVCHEPINTLADAANMDIFFCGQCGTRLNAVKGTARYSCPVCDFENDVAERMMSEKIKKDGLVSIIKYEGDNNTFIWKHPIEDFNYGSQLIVHESQEAIFFKDGQALDLFGPGRYTLETQQLPLLEKLYALPTNGKSAFHTEVYFINKTVQMAIKWGTPEKLRFIDPLSGTPLELGACGTMNLQVDNSRKLLLKLVGTMKGISWNESNGFSKSLQESFRPLITTGVKTNLSNVIKDEAIDLLEIDSKLDIISESLRNKLLPGFEEYGLTIPQFFVTNVELPENDPNFKRIRELHTITLQTRMLQAEATIKTAQAQSETQYRTAQEQSKAAIEAAHREAELQRQTTETEIAKREAERRVIEAQAKAQADRLTGFADAEIMQAKGYNQKDVIQADVQKAYAEGIGNMGPVISSGGGSSIMGDMLGLGVGMAAAGAIAPQLGGMFQGMNPMSINTANGNPSVHNSSMTCGQTGDNWDCTCGNKATGRFCNNCGAQRPIQTSSMGDTWDCTCGNRNVIGNFCNNCGAKRPERMEPKTWDCSCGNKGIIGNFCNNCGKKRGE